jgi:hypothetical protein
VISPTVAPVVRFLGLTEVAETAWGEVASFPLGVLYPYSRDLQRVCERFDAVLQDCPEYASRFIGEVRREVASLSPEQLETVNSYLESIATLASRIAFAPGTAGRSVATAYRRVSDAIAHNRSIKTTGPGRRGGPLMGHPAEQAVSLAAPPPPISVSDGSSGRISATFRP